MELDNEFNIKESEILKHGTTPTTFELDGVKIGLGIGYDMSFSELSTLYKKAGCEMLIYPAAYPAGLGHNQWEQLNRTRAIDNQIYVAAVSAARDDTADFVVYGNTMLTDPTGRILTRAFDREDILYDDLNFTAFNTYRNQIKLSPQRRCDVYDTIPRFK